VILQTVVLSIASSSVIPERTDSLEANEVVVQVVCTFSANELVARAHRAGANRIYDPKRHFQNETTRDFHDKSSGAVGSDSSPMGALLFVAASAVVSSWIAADEAERPCFALLARFSPREPGCSEKGELVFTSLLEQVSRARTQMGWPASEAQLGKCWKESSTTSTPSSPGDASASPLL